MCRRYRCAFVLWPDWSHLVRSDEVSICLCDGRTDSINNHGTFVISTVQPRHRRTQGKTLEKIFYIPIFYMVSFIRVSCFKSFLMPIHTSFVDMKSSLSSIFMYQNVSMFLVEKVSFTFRRVV